ncbi:hypothetical protein [Sagittula salina]|uniref:Uncharacterized protein n=1 Tax=Sagittula salina TaxID=2820268 RepID=A0A940MLH4_9RHOB|nr:hypothetical protein [Sagittula salina]MBP0483701.1 hypothetical protein [Sagittula salina]
MTVLLAILVIAALAFWSWRTRGGGMGAAGGQPKARKACDWQPMGEPRGRLREFRCAACGVTAFSTNAEGPELCKRGLADGRPN